MLNFNTQPYYDDFNEDKNFHRILFKPGSAVQARELTQAQTILQDQIGKFGKFVLSDGSNVSGGKYSLNSNAKSLNLQDYGSIATDIEFFNGMFVVGETSKCVSVITSSDILNYYIIVKSLINSVQNYSSGENLLIFSTKSLAYSYLNNSSITPDYTAKLATDQITNLTGGCSGQKDSYTFSIPLQTISVGDIITTNIDNYSINYIVTEIGYDGTFLVNQQLKTDYNNTVGIRITSLASNIVLQVNFSEGVYFTNNAFVKALPQSIIPNARTQYPSCCVGFEVIETIVDYIDDTSLLDPAQGSYNYTAPGADRYKIYLNLVSKPLVNGGLDQTTLTNSKFIELVRIKNGIIVYDNTSPTLGGLEDVLAAQMYDHAGNFIVSPFNITFNESDFSDMETTLNATVSAGKAYIFGYPYNATFPTYLTIDKARETANSYDNITSTYYGNSIRIKDVAGKLPMPSTGSRVEVHSAGIGNTSDATRLGYAYVSNIDYTTTNEYSLYLHNVGVPENKMAIANSIIGASFSANTILTNNINVVTDATYNKLLFKLPYSNPDEISNGIVTLDTFTTLSVVSSSVTLSTGSLTKQFSSGTATALSSDLKKQNFIIVAKSTNGAYTAGQYIDLDNVIIKVEKLVSEYRATFTFTDGYAGQIEIKYSLTHTSPQQKAKTLVSNQVAQINCTTLPTSIGYSDIAKFKGVYKAPSNAALLVGDWNPGLTYDKYAVVRYGSKVFMSLVSDNIADVPSETSTKWTLMPDVSKDYKLDNGQREFIYDHGTVSALTAGSAGKIFVLFDYYQHGEGEYIAFDSYSGGYKNIPTVKLNNTIYELKDYIDFRPRRKDATDSATILFDSYNIPTSITDPRFSYDMKYYLGRIDKLMLTSDKKLIWAKGKSSYRNYVPPKDLPNALTVATIQLNPYTADTLAIKTTYTKHRRYTMDDIGSLDTRLQNVEYYTALTMAEKATLSTNIIDEYGTRLKNGFIVDSFTGFSIIDLSINNKNICLDLDKNTARPYCSKQTHEVAWAIDDLGEDDSLYNKKGLITFPKISTNLIIQDQATSYVKINQFDSISYQGDLHLNPQSYVWVEQYGETINVVNEDTAALAAAQDPSSLLFNNWNTFYSSHKDYIIDPKSSSKDISVTNTTTGGQTVYNVTTAIGGAKETTKDIINASFTAKAKAMDIHFAATGLAPLTRMYVYVNGRFMNGYVTPDKNPTGMICGTRIENGGAGYSGTSTASLSSNTATIQATFDLTVIDGKIDSAFITNPGKGYNNNTNGYELTINSSTTPTTTANVFVTTMTGLGSTLYSDICGDCSGILHLPNTNALSFDAGELVITVCDTPHLDIGNALSRAQATFYSKHTAYEKTITSIREPYISFVKEIAAPPKPPRKGNISVPQSVNYKLDMTNYSPTGVIDIPVFLSGDAPTSDVIVKFIVDASRDQSAKITSVTPSVSGTIGLTFTPTNYKEAQHIQLSYNLGARGEHNTGSEIVYIPNLLSTYIEFYAYSTDPTYAYIGGLTPAESWKTNGIVGVATTNLNAIVSNDHITYTPPESITVTDLTISNEGGQGSFTVTYGGGDDIGYWTSATTTYPLTFTATSDNSNVVITSSEYSDDTTTSPVTKSGNVYTLDKKTDNKLLTFKFNIYGQTQGLANVTVTITSANSKWNSKSDISHITVGAALPTAAADIIVHPNSETNSTETSVLRYTNSTGKTNVIGVTLSKAPTSSVTVKANSSNIVIGDVINYTNDFSSATYASGNTVTFTTSNWNQMHSFVVTGYNDPSNLTTINSDYNIDLKSSSSDSSFNNITKRIGIVHNDYAETKGDVDYKFSGYTTTGNGSKISLSCTLTKKPVGQVKVGFVSDNETTGGIIITPSRYVGSSANGTFLFDSTNWNIPQNMEIQGAALESGGDVSYNLNCFVREWDTNAVMKWVTPSIWTNDHTVKLKNLVYKYTSESLVITDRSRTYTAKPLGRDPSVWTPELNIVNVTFEVTGGKIYENPYVIYSALNNSPNFKQYLSKNDAVYTVMVPDISSGIKATDTTKQPKTDALTVIFELQPKQNDVMFSKTIYSKPSVITIADVPATSNDKTGKYYCSVLPNGNLRVKSEVPFKSMKAGQRISFNYGLVIRGIYYDPITPGFEVMEYTKTTTTTTVFRSDTYVQVGDPVIKTIPSAQDPVKPLKVDWKINAMSRDAAYQSITKGGAYSSLLPSDIGNLFGYGMGPTTTSMKDAFDIETLKLNQQSVKTIIDNITTKIKLNGSNANDPLNTILDQEWKTYNDITAQISTIDKSFAKTTISDLSSVYANYKELIL